MCVGLRQVSVQGGKGGGKRQTGRQTDGRTDGRTDRQTDRERERERLNGGWGALRIVWRASSSEYSGRGRRGE